MIKTGEQILRERFGNDVDEENACPLVYGFDDKCLSTIDEGCEVCWERYKAANYGDQGNGVYVPVEGEKE